MKPSQDTTAPPEVTTLSDVLAWQQSLRLLHAGLASHFARPEPFARALRFVQGILSTVERKNSWQLAEQAREATPYGMQRLLSQAVWDADGVRDELRAFVLQQLGSSPLTVAIDESGFLKRGQHSAGVGKQHYGPTGDVRNCQVGVFLSLVTATGHTLIDRELYLPTDWTTDPARSREAGISEHVAFRTKPQLAQRMLERLLHAHVPIAWVVADSVYGSNPELRAWLESRQLPYVMAVACDEPVVVELSQLGVRRLEVRDVAARLVPTDWQRLSMSQGSKGPRLFAWACLPIWHQGQDDGWHSVLLRRTLDPTPELTYYLVFAPPATCLQDKVSALGGRWRIEEDFENGKDLGLDHYEVRSFVGWYRHITLVMLALAFLTGIALAAHRSAAPLLPVASPATEALISPEMCPLSVPEARHLLARLLFPAPSSAPLVLAWSGWRRRHQQQARVCHGRQRLKAG
jgi:SRSO17 transposase